MYRTKYKLMRSAHHGLALLFGIFLGTLWAGESTAAELDLSNVPLDVQEGVEPNILLTFDDSGSMTWSYLPDGIANEYNDERGASSSYNRLYYNPQIRYTPGVDENGASLGNSNFTAAWTNGYSQSACVKNLSNEYRASWEYGNNCDSNSGTREFHTAVPSSDYSGEAYYYTFDPTNTSCDGTVNDDDCYDAVIINSVSAPFAGGPGRTDCVNPTSCTYAEEAQNFANWYSYYRSRMLLAKTAAGSAFSQIAGKVRVSRQSLNTYTTIPIFETFTGSDREDFFSWLYGIPNTTSSTPLRNAHVRSGTKFSESGINSPYAKDPGVTGTPEYSCRQNFHIAFTDGYWNGPAPSVDNYDNVNHDIPTNSFGIDEYTPRPPYNDGNENYIADLAMKYWITDLRPDLDDNVPTFIKDSNSDFDGDGDIDDADTFWNPVNDPASWQHVVTFNVGLGIDGLLEFNDTTYNNLVSGATAWTADKVDDLWHASINGRGQYFSAKNPGELVSAFADVLTAIEERIGSSSAPAPSAPFYEAGTILFQPTFDTSDWSGDLRAFDVTNLSTPIWHSRDQINSQDHSTDRKIITHDTATGTGAPFRWTSLSVAQKAHLADDENVLNYIRGNKSNELSGGGTFRNRTYVLGDIVNSEPVFVGPPDRMFPDSLETVPYTTFATSYSSRPEVVWVGANDGMLHGIDADTGRELLAYVPGKVYKNLASLTSPSYAHRFFVDGSPTERDVFYDDAWHTVLVGGLNAGGQAVYALDITDPSTFNESNAANIVRWEFTDEHDADLGYTFSKPEIARMNNGQWMAIFGNGYNNTVNDDSNGYCSDSDPDTHCPVSSTGDAVLFLVDIQNGPNTAGGVFKLSTETGRDEDPTDTITPNGLASVEVIDVNGDFMVDYIYAGDLFGNLWKFDVTDSDPGNWQVFRDIGGNPKPLFTATDASGNHQPITSAPVVGRHTTQSGYMVNVGTGKYLEFANLSDTSLQTFYGIWDRNEAEINTITREHLAVQEILFTSTDQFSAFDARVTSVNDFRYYTEAGLPPGSPPSEFLGWRMDLVDETATLRGERVMIRPQRRGERIIFSTVIPSENPCSAGGESWLMEVNAVTGKRLPTTPFDFDRDGNFAIGDLVQVPFDVNGDGIIDEKDVLVGSGISEKGAGRQSRPTILIDEKGDEQKIMSNSDGSLSRVKESGQSHGLGRRSWIQLLTN